MNLLFLFGLAVLLFFLIAGISAAPWVPARQYDVPTLLSLLKLPKRSVIYELGCGDGRLVLAMAGHGYMVHGYEINPILWLIAKWRCRGQENAVIHLRSLWKVDLQKPKAVVAFLVPRTMPKLAKKAQGEMQANTILISYVFDLPGKEPVHKKKPWLVYEY